VVTKDLDFHKIFSTWIFRWKFDWVS